VEETIPGEKDGAECMNFDYAAQMFRHGTDVSVK
jgi:hypothetical protein